MKSQEIKSVEEIQEKLERLGNPSKARFLQGFFKTGPGEYGEGDIFVGIRVPVIRKLAKEYRFLSLPVTLKLLRSPIHEARLLALLILVGMSQRGDEGLQKQITNSYLNHTRFINNWDLVDVSAPRIIGPQIPHLGENRLLRLAASSLLWDRRISILSTFYLITKKEFDLTIKIAERLLQDPEDLIHKAVGWMLREVGKRNLEIEESFLKKYYQLMPRTMLRYAIEKFSEDLRQDYLNRRI